MRFILYAMVIVIFCGNETVFSQQLRNILHEKAKNGHKVLSYKELWQALAEIDLVEDAGRKIRLFYTNRIQDKTIRSVTDNNNGWNREHLWPQSRGTQKLPMKSDLHHVHPVDASVNRRRGNLDFGEDGKPEGEAPNTFIGKRNFEPRNEIKGDIARSLFYMDIRYEGRSGNPDLQLVKKFVTRKSNNVGNLCMLLIWHKEDPVDTIERNRHDRVARIQGNRNPFIDTPSVANQLFGSKCETRNNF
ncbi:MAG: Extracellular ribonuclease [Hyphomicrobiaceae bacterium hypho_1]